MMDTAKTNTPENISLVALKAESEPHTTSEVIFSPFLALIEEICNEEKRKKKVR
jgi:hypothetical protein